MKNKNRVWPFLSLLSLLFPTQILAVTCNIYDINSLKTCFSYIGSYDTFNFTNNVLCTDAQCCGASVSPLIMFNYISNKTINGNGYTLTRIINQKSQLCPLIRITNNSSSITISNLKISESGGMPQCGAYDGCSNTIIIEHSQGITLSSLEVVGSKSTGISVWGASNFSLANSSIVNSGVLGVYVGNEVWNAYSTGVKIQNNLLRENRVNAIAIEGVTGNSLSSNIISGNMIIGNHRFGLWPSDRPPYPTGGGQLYIPRSNYMTVIYNTIADGFCTNCFGNAAMGIEIGDPGAGTYVPVKNTLITNNRVYNNTDVGIYVNRRSGTSQYVATDASLSVRGNMISNTKSPIDAPSNILGANTIRNLRVFSGWESGQLGSNFPTGWNLWQTCTNGSTMNKWCPGTGSEVMTGNCLMRSKTNGISCAGGGAFARGLYTPITAGITVNLSIWSRDGASYHPKGCLLFLNSSYTELAKHCRNVTPDGWTYNANDLIEAVAPAGTAFLAVELENTASNAYVDTDEIRISW